MRGDEEAKTGERKERERGKRKNSREEEEGSNCALFLIEGIVGSEKWGVILGGEMEACLTGFSFPPPTAERRRLTFPSNS